MACDPCHLRKTRCDRKLPRCSSCVKRDLHCHYPSRVHYRQLEASRLEALENKVRLLEKENEGLRQQRSNRPQEPPTPEQSGIDTQSPARNPEPPREVTPATGDDRDVHITAHDPRPTGSSMPATQPRFYGSVAGVDFVDLVESVVDVSGASNGVFNMVTAELRSAETSPSTQLSPSRVPERHVAKQLVDVYFEHWHVTFPLLYRPAFLDLVEIIYEDLSFYAQNPAAAFVFDIVLALGSAALRRFEWSFKDTEAHFTRASCKLDEILRYRDIRALQALLLCCQYGIHASLRDTAEEMWHLLGQAGRLCVELGLHRSRLSPRSAKNSIHLTGPIPTSVEIEMRHRCFWCFYNLDRYSHPDLTHI